MVKTQSKSKNHKRKIKLNWKILLIGVLCLIFALIILAKFIELQNIVDLLKQVKLGWLITALVIQFLVFVSLGALYKTILSKKISLWYFVKTSIAMVFIDHTIPSFSASGNVLLFYSARQKNIKKARASLLILLNIFLNFLFYFIIFIIGLAYLLISKKIIGLEWVWIPLVLVVALFVLLNRILWTKNGQRHFKISIAWLLRRWPNAKKKTLSNLNDLFKAKKNMKRKVLSKAIFFSFLSYVFRIAAVGAVFLALGELINPGILLTGYFITSFISTISYIRLGVYEASMTGAYTALGINYDMALTATLLYRLFAFWIPMVVGFIFFRLLIKNNNKNNKNK